jgi:ArsR family metal-binding transcriptional regulator
MRDFERRFNRMRRIFWVIFITAAVIIFGSYVLVGVVGVKVAKNPEGTAEKAGELARSWKEAFEKGYKVEVSEDTVVVDTLNVEN